MPTKINKKQILTYGLSMGLLLVVMQAINYNMMIRQIRMEVYGLIIALIFLAIGIWLGLTFKKDKKPKKGNSGIKLSNRELDVLKLMSKGLTNQQIADTLYLSLNTIKTHTSNIYSKLAVERRTQAIQKARELHLF